LTDPRASLIQRALEPFFAFGTMQTLDKATHAVLAALAEEENGVTLDFDVIGSVPPKIVGKLKAKFVEFIPARCAYIFPLGDGEPCNRARVEHGTGKPYTAHAFVPAEAAAEPELKRDKTLTVSVSCRVIEEVIHYLRLAVTMSCANYVCAQNGDGPQWFIPQAEGAINSLIVVLEAEMKQLSALRS